MRRDPGDIIDRLSIALLKVENIGTPQSKQEVAAFMDGLLELIDRHPTVDWLSHLTHMKDINGRIWRQESAVRAGALDNNPLEVGVRAIAIRRANTERIALKNRINTLTGEGVQDVKADHLSGD